MKIKKLNLISYGKFENKEICLKDGLNIISGENGSGKSTIMAFIQAMLFGFGGRGGVSINDRKHYLPWGKTTLSGSIDIVTDNQKEIKLSRVSGKSQGFDKSDCFDMSNSEELNFSPEEIIGCGEDAFLKTLCIRQLSSTFSGEESEISKKLINLTHSACEDIDTEKTIEIITDYMKYFKALRGDKGKISELEGAIADINERIHTAKEKRLSAFTLATKQKKILEQKDICSEELSAINKRLEGAKSAELFARLNSIKEEEKSIKESIDINKKTLGEIEALLSSLSSYNRQPPPQMFAPPLETRSLEKTKEETDKKIKNWRLCTVISSLLTVLSLAGGFLYAPVFGASLLFVIGIIVSLININKLKASLSDTEHELEKTNNDNLLIKELLSSYGVEDIREYTVNSAKYTKALAEKESLTSHLSSLSERYEKVLSEKAEYEKKTEGLIAPDEAENYDFLHEKQRTLTDEIQSLIGESSRIDGILCADTDADNSENVLTTELEKLKKERDEAVKEYEAASVALDTMNLVFSQMRSDFTPLVNEKASQYLSQITDGDIDKIYIDKKFSVTAEKEGVKELAYFSLGTADQTYFAIRLAIIDLLFGNDKPIFIDDAFVQYDTIREEKAFELLKRRAADGQQIIFFTCKPYKMGGDVNLVSL